MPVVGEYSAAVTFSGSIGSRALASSPVSSSNPGTPLALPCSSFFRRVCSPRSPKLTIMLPQRSKGTSSSAQSFSILALPRTVISAFRLPGLLS